MKRRRLLTTVLALVLAGRTASAQHPAGRRPFLSNLHATAASPIYTTYAAALERSRFLLDEGYHLRFYDPDRPLELVNARAGNWGLVFDLDGRSAWRVRDLASPPVITVSYGDVVRCRLQPFPGVDAEVTVLVYSSRVAVQRLEVVNRRTTPIRLQVGTWVLVPRGVAVERLDRERGEARFRHGEPPDGWTKEHAVPYVADVRNALVFSRPPDELSAVGDSTLEPGEPTRNAAAPDSARGVRARVTLTLGPGARAEWRVARAVAPADSSIAAALGDARRMLTAPLEPFIRADERLYRRIPEPPTTDPDRQLLYWGAFTLLRQVMLPPEGRAKRPYYVFSREPQWGWGHGGQVFHESLSMLAYALMDPAGAMASQRVFADRQHADGYIPYRVGPYLDETIPYEGQLTTSAPWYAWESWEIYRITRDLSFLRDMYASGSRFYEWLAAHRDADHDGLYEWGGHGVLESVRDGDVAVWDQVGWPSNFEALDLNAMMVSEASALDSMATALSRRDDAARWRARADALRDRIERTFWDDSTSFYYHVDLRTNGFSFKTPGDLKRREIIGFLPLWAGTPTPERATRLIGTLADPKRFWRRNGVPSLAADDPYYKPDGYWNGPVWVEWDYLVERGLLRYGRGDLARELVDRVAANMEAQLRKSHVFWEMYGPDGEPGAWAGHHQVYIWAGLIARMMLDAAAPTNSATTPAGPAPRIQDRAASGAKPWRNRP